MNTFGNNIKTLRESKKLTQASLAENTGLSAQFISFLERGVRKPSDNTISTFSQFFNLSKDDLLQVRGEE